MGSERLTFSTDLYDISVPENKAPVNLLTLQTHSKPFSNADSHHVTYAILQGDVNGTFTLDRSSGKLSLQVPLDYEQGNKYELLVSATMGPARAFSRINVQVQDVNEHTPKFKRPSYETQVTEGDSRELPKKILQVLATDQDGGCKGKLMYSLHGDSVSDVSLNVSSIRGALTSDANFAMDYSSGEIYLLKALDRDPPTGKAQWNLNVGASDGLRTARAPLLVNVKDINDNAPFFPHLTVKASVMENGPQGYEVIQAEALDYDDPTEGSNTAITFSLQKNVIDESSGEPLFDIESKTGRITTALCCLDREKTAAYTIQVVATDGGGLKGTGTVYIEIEDENDNSAEFLELSSEFFISESTLLNETFATLKINDPDLENRFLFKIIPDSGPGWDRFHVVQNSSNTGALILLKPLDYEDPEQLPGFRFIVQVTDKCSEEMDEPVHWASAWVHIHLLDENDHSPVFSEARISLAIPEDTHPGGILTRFTATDADEGENSRIFYSLKDSTNSNIFTIDTEGHIHVGHPLDRETQPTHTLEVIARDNGQPPHSGTSLVLVNVTDINDNPPFIKSPERAMIFENSPPRFITEILLSDADDWQRGHGPPFDIILDPATSWNMKTSFKVTFNPNGDDGKGSATLQSLIPLDREEGKVRSVPLVVRDAGGLTATVTLPVIIGDINDNPMAPGNKRIKVIKPKNAYGRIKLGRVFVDDPDDWDAEEKVWEWHQVENHHVFTVDSKTGMLFADAEALNHRYHLHFHVSDQTHHQINVTAAVDITIETIENDVKSYQYAVPIHITSHSPTQLILQEKGISKIEALLEAINIFTKDTFTLLALSPVPTVPNRKIDRGKIRMKYSQFLSTLWMKPRNTNYFRHLGFMKKEEIFKKTNVRIKSFGPRLCVQLKHENSQHGQAPMYFFSVTDANTTSLVTPILQQTKRCNCRNKNGYPQAYVNKGQSQPLQMRRYANALRTCDPNPCLNEGRCLLTEHGPKCICPSGTDTITCKQRSRQFKKGGWIQIESIPISCSNLHLSIQFRTKALNGVLIYIESESENYFRSSEHRTSHLKNSFLLELVNGRPRAVTRIGRRQVDLELPSSSSTLQKNSLPLNCNPSHLADPWICLSDGLWHRIDIFWTLKDIHLQVVDMCLKLPDECHASAAFLTASGESENSSTTNIIFWGVSPMYVGGLPIGEDKDQSEKYRRYKSTFQFQGCVHNLRINQKIIDLGRDKLERRTSPGCESGEFYKQKDKENCFLDPNRCFMRTQPISCPWTSSKLSDKQCSENVSASTLNSKSHIIVSPIFAIPKVVTSIHLRFRTWNFSGRLLGLSTNNGGSLMSLLLIDGHLCFISFLKHVPTISEEYFIPQNFTLCLLETTLNDGLWHSAKFFRNFYLAELSADGGDWPFYNSTLLHKTSVSSSPLNTESKMFSTESPSFKLATDMNSMKPPAVYLNNPKIELQIGGIANHPESKEQRMSQHHFHGCVDSIYVWDRHLPLPLPQDNRDWAQFPNSITGVERGCSNSSICFNVICPKPLKCVEIWRRHKCSCGDGKVLSDDGENCVDINECLWKPCLIGGTCINEDSTYSCLCPPRVSGKNCEIMSNENSTDDSLSLGILLGAIICSSFIILSLFGFFLFLRLKNRQRRESSGQVNEEIYTEKTTNSFIEKLKQYDETVAQTSNQKAMKKDECRLGLDVLRVNSEFQPPLPCEKHDSLLTFQWTSYFQTKGNEVLPMTSTKSHHASIHRDKNTLSCSPDESREEKVKMGQEPHPAYVKKLGVYDPGILPGQEYDHSDLHVNKVFH